MFSEKDRVVSLLAATTVIILQDVTDGKMDSFFAKNA